MELAVEFHGCGPLNTTVLREQRFYLGVAWRIGTVVLARDGGSGRLGQLFAAREHNSERAWLAS